ncbi:MAPEG family protein [Sphingobium sp. AN558]|uniref:MAPEG family protein n=1 Tax=Sphingobium sp. AN558 TaxID=3133442 RepID=UPI0030BDD304
MLLPITLTLAAACALINLWLAVRCTLLRMATKTLHGDGGDPRLARRMRAHANFTEYTPIILILFALIELANGASIILWAGAAIYVAARLAHGVGMDGAGEGPHPMRAIGATATWLVMLALAFAALYVAYSATRALPAPPAMAQAEPTSP